MRVPLPTLIAEGGEGEDVGILIDFEAGGLEGGLEALEFGRKDAVLQVHGGGGVLHGAIVDDDELLDVVGDGCLAVAGEFGGRGQTRGQAEADRESYCEESLFRCGHKVPSIS